jgi:hypothetical protein
MTSDFLFIQTFFFAASIMFLGTEENIMKASSGAPLRLSCETSCAPTTP